VSISQRDQWVRIYAYTPAESQGFVSHLYECVDAQWGRLEPPTGREGTFGQSGEFTVEGIVLLPDYATVEPGSLLAVEGEYWKVHAALPRRLTAEIQCLCSRHVGEELVITS